MSINYRDICIKFDTDEQAQAFAEAVHKNGHAIRYWEPDYNGDTIGYHDAYGLHRDSTSFHNRGMLKHISEAHAEWLRFLLSPARSPIKVAGHVAHISAESAKIGCTTVTWDEVEAVYKAMKEARK